jgi:hypothetical protein
MGHGWGATAFWLGPLFDLIHVWYYLISYAMARRVQLITWYIFPNTSHQDIVIPKNTPFSSVPVLCQYIGNSLIT